MALQFDARFPHDTIHQGIYGVRLRYMPDPYNAPWYAFAGVMGAFSIHEVRHFGPSEGGPGTSERMGGIAPPMVLSGGVGHRMTSGQRWNLNLEGEAWTGGSGLALGVNVELSFTAARGALKTKR